MDRNHWKYIALASEYYGAAKLLRREMTDSSQLYNPIMYLTRHTIELIIKAMIYKEFGDVSNEKTVKKRRIDDTHDLLELWYYYWDRDQQFLLPTLQDRKRVEPTIKWLNDRDNDSTKYRYPKKKKSNSYLDMEPITLDERIAPSLSSKPPLLIVSPYNAKAVTKGKSLMVKMQKVFYVIDYLFKIYVEY